MTRLGLVTGLVVEAARIEAVFDSEPESERPFVGVAGGSAERAASVAMQHLENGADVLVSFGIAGGLDPSRSPGDIVVGTFVWQDADLTQTDTAPAWTQLLAERIGLECRVETGGVAGIDTPVMSSAGKALLRDKTDAVAADMESHGVARVAAKAGIPLLVIRAIADPATRAIPAAALVGMGPDGHRRPFAVLGKLLTRPQDLPGIIGLARDSSAALGSLAVAARILLKTRFS